VVAIPGSTYDGVYEPVAEIAAALDTLQQEKGIDVPMHVDGASGGFIAPFIDPELIWDFRVPRVQSINTSGHKFGLVYPGVGWIVWREPKALPEELVFHVDYLPDDISSYTVYDVSEDLRGGGWLVPACRMPPNIDDTAVLRVVVRQRLQLRSRTPAAG
jgi:glutamate decarboxylase